MSGVRCVIGQDADQLFGPKLSWIFRQHCLHAVQRCGLLLNTSHAAWSVCLSVFAWHTGELCRKNSRTDLDAV